VIEEFLMPVAVREIDVAALAAARQDGAVVIDVREPDEYIEGHVPCARLIPLSSVPRHARDLPTDRPVSVICRTGVRSAAAAQMLEHMGIDALSVAGGTEAWKAAGYPVVTGSYGC
jgi:rhodanese-related sulfurtransferase